MKKYIYDVGLLLRSRMSFWLGLLSMALVLLLLGMLTAFTWLGYSFANRAQSNFVMRVFLHDGVGERQKADVLKRLADANYATSVVFVSKDSAAKILLEKTGEDVMTLMDGVNPLLASYNVSLRADYVEVDKLEALKSGWESELAVAEVSFPLELLLKAQKNLTRLLRMSLLMALLVGGICLLLIFSSIRLSIYAERLKIRTMQLIGATDGYIRRPYIIRGVIQGSAGGLMASLVLLFLMLWLRSYFGTELVIPTVGFIGILGGIVLFGASLGSAGSYMAVSHYLGKGADELF